MAIRVLMPQSGPFSVRELELLARGSPRWGAAQALFRGAFWEERETDDPVDALFRAIVVDETGEIFGAVHAGVWDDSGHMGEDRECWVKFGNNDSELLFVDGHSDVSTAMEAHLNRHRLPYRRKVN